MDFQFFKDNTIFEKIFNHISLGIAVLKEYEKVMFVNSYFEKVTGYTLDEIIEGNICILSYLRHKEPEKYREVINKLQEKSFWRGMLWVETPKENKLIPVLSKVISLKKDNQIYTIEIISDSTELIKTREYANFLKYYNQFLKLPNKTFLKEKIENKIKLNEKFSLLLITLNNLKTINDSMGIEIGDKALKIFSNSLKKIVEKLNSFLFYPGGNQFVVLIHSVDRGKIEKIVNMLHHHLLDTAQEIENFEILFNISIGGYSVIQKETFSSIMHKLLIANEFSKKNQRKFIFFDPKFKKQIQTKFEIENLVKYALKNNRFILYYQPRVNLKKLKVESVEALIRIKLKDGRLISPGIFIPVAEESKLINKIGDWVINQVVEDARYIAMKSSEKVRFSFNVSTKQFIEYNFLNKMEEMYNRSQDFISLFQIEVTEGALMKNVEATIEKMFKLKEMGFKLIIDDFGTGYSSLAYLKKFPIDYLKIDKSFIDKIPEDEKSVKIVDSILYLAKQLELETTAEGVENADQYNWLKNYNCDEIQGYYFSKPLEKEELINFIKVFNKTIERAQYIKWEDNFSSGIPSFDTQHMIIINILNQIYDELHNKELVEKTSIKVYLDMLYNYMKLHFSEEEEFLIAHHYPDITKHIQVHMEFQNKIKQIKEKFMQGKERLDHELFGILKDWFKNHILKYDKEYFHIKL